MRISDWSSDVCSSDLSDHRIGIDVERQLKPPVIVEKEVGVGSLPASECRGADEAFIIGDRFLFVDKTGERKLEAEPCAARVVAAADRRAECHGIAAAHRYRRAGQKRLEGVMEINGERAGTTGTVAFLAFIARAQGYGDRWRCFPGYLTEHRAGVGCVAE